ncbi:DUF6089 family protein [Aquirufa sp. ROCK-SH2]
MKKISSYSFLLLLIISFSAHSQFWFLGQKGKKAQVLSKFKAYSSVTFGAGSANYIGELVPLAAFTTLAVPTTRWNAGFQYTRHFSRKFSAKGSISYIRIAGDDNYYNYTAPGGLFDANFARNLHFSNDIKEISLSGIWEILGNVENPEKRVSWAPYFTLGVAGILHNPLAREAANITNPASPVQKDWVSLRDQNTENSNYGALAVSIPFGFGLRKKITNNIDLGFEVTYRVALTDYLDDVSDKRAALIGVSSPYFNRSINEIKSTVSGINYNEQYAANTMRALPPYNTFVPQNNLSETPGVDQYFTTQIQFIYHIKNKMECPPLPR